MPRCKLPTLVLLNQHCVTRAKTAHFIMHNSDQHYFTRIALLIAVMLLAAVGIAMPSLSRPLSDELGEAIIGIAAGLLIYPRVAGLIMRVLMWLHSRHVGRVE